MTLKHADPFAVTVAMLPIKNDFAARWAMATGNCGDGGGLAFVGVRQVTGVVDKFGGTAYGAFHVVTLDYLVCLRPYGTGRSSPLHCAKSVRYAPRLPLGERK